MGELAVALLMGLTGLGLWLRVVRPTLPGTPDEREGTGLIGLFVVGMLLSVIAAGFFGTPDAELPFDARIRGLAASNAVAVLAVLLLVRAHPRGRDAVGMVAQRSGSPWLAGLATYLMAAPLVALLTLLNHWVIELLPGLVDDPEGARRQQLLEQFLAGDGARSPMIWLCMTLVIPFAEELLFRGALYGGLRGRLGPLGAAVISALVFGLLHYEPGYLLPLSGLGVALAWIYERTGSLAAPTVTHMLTNLLTLALQSVPSPEATP